MTCWEKVIRLNCKSQQNDTPILKVAKALRLIY